MFDYKVEALTKALQLHQGQSAHTHFNDADVVKTAHAFEAFLNGTAKAKPEKKRK